MAIFGYSFFGFLIAIAILVAVHEFGHFWMARKLGVRVLRFSIGFGKPIYTWRRANDTTEYVLALIPLGGYVKMLDEREGEVDPAEAHLAFNNQSLAVRSAVVAAGPLFNLIFAIVAMWLLFMTGIADLGTVIGEVTPRSVAEAAGFKVGDRLVSIDDMPVKTWSQHRLYLLNQGLKGEDVKATVQDASGVSHTRMIGFQSLDQDAINNKLLRSGIGIQPELPEAVISEVVTGSPAEQSGIRPGDKIVAIEKKPIANWIDLVTAVSTKPDAQLLVELEREQQIHHVAVTTERVSTEAGDIGRIGVSPMPLANQVLKFGPVAALQESLAYNWRLSGITLRSLWQMLTARMSTDNLSGPITIARYAGQTARSGYVSFIKFLALVSISLGILNLLPIPVLDGGHLLFFLIELVTRSPVSEQMMIRGQQLGLLLLGLLMSLAFYNDIISLF